MTPNPKRLSYPPTYRMVNSRFNTESALTELVDRLQQLYDMAAPGSNAEELRQCVRLAQTIRRVLKEKA